MNREAPTPSELRKGVLAFRKHESRDAMYRIAALLVRQFWGQPRDLADSVGVLLLTWNQAHYRYGPLDFARLERFLKRYASTLDELHARHISTFSSGDTRAVRSLFASALKALEIAEGKSKGRRSPVAVAKALHLLAPEFLPLWDYLIAKGYGCSYATDPIRAYLAFMQLQQNMVVEFRDTIESLADGKTALKVLDEYNYARFTKGWV